MQLYPKTKFCRKNNTNSLKRSRGWRGLFQYNVFAIFIVTSLYGHTCHNPIFVRAQKINFPGVI